MNFFLLKVIFQIRLLAADIVRFVISVAHQIRYGRGGWLVFKKVVTTELGISTTYCATFSRFGTTPEDESLVAISRRYLFHGQADRASYRFATAHIVRATPHFDTARA
jgi:hypothetical protein